MTGSNVVSAVPAEKERLIAALVTAFSADPFIRWMFPEPRQYLVFFPQVLEFFAGGGFDHESAYRTEDFTGAALWLPPGVSPDEESLGQVMEEGVAPARQEEVFAVLEQVGTSHPEAQHWYLPAIGVDPMCQGRGYGSVLMAHALEVCDRDQVAAYLESTNPLNIPLYERFGFEIVGEIQAGSSPVVTPMFREAR